MPFDDPVGTIKLTIDTIRSAIGMVRDVGVLSGGTAEQKQKIDKALTTAASSAAMAEVQILKALGYELCKCQVPPTPMLTVGWRIPPGSESVETVYECPKCGFNTAGGFTFTRTQGKNPPE
jgi:hypothetical protein